MGRNNQPQPNKTPSLLNEYHRKRNEQVIKEVAEQPLMTREECIAQVKRLKEQSLSRRESDPH